MGGPVTKSDLFDAIRQISPDSGVARRAMKHLDRVYEGVSFEGRRVLDIGGGLGTHSYYAASKGAVDVTCLEPDDAGSQEDFASASVRFKEAVGLHDNVQFIPERLQEFNSEAKKFDIVILHNSINHMDEDACIRLPEDQGAASTYTEVFSKIASLAQDNAMVIIADCSSRNFFRKLGIKNPVAPTIEWHKHQPPEVWLSLMRPAGLVEQSTVWIVPARFGDIGQVLLGNRLGAYFLSSYFRIIATKG